MNNNISFPLFDNLSKDLENEEMSQKEQDKFIKLIKTFDISGQELIYILILCYYLQHNDNNKIVLPYNGKFINEDISFDFLEFPDDLKKILFKFSKIHVKKMKEENLIKENRTEIKKQII